MRAEVGWFTTWLSIETHSNLVIICSSRLFVQCYITNTNQPLVQPAGFLEKPIFKNKSAHKHLLSIWWSADFSSQRQRLTTFFEADPPRCILVWKSIPEAGWGWNKGNSEDEFTYGQLVQCHPQMMGLVPVQPLLLPGLLLPSVLWLPANASEHDTAEDQIPDEEKDEW